MKSNLIFARFHGGTQRAWIACLGIAFFLVGPAIAADTCGSLERVNNAIRLAQVLYPELEGRELSVQFSEGNGGPL
jgi:hypothetical protein